MITLTIMDEVNCHFDGLTEHQTTTLVEALKYPVPGAFTTAGYKLGVWDGKESLFEDDGFTFVYLIDQVLDVLEHKLRVDLSKIELIDQRTFVHPHIPLIDKNFLLKESGLPLRDHQVEAINTAISNGKGYINAATSSGKTLICLGISKAFDKHLKSVVVVPSANLARQTFNDYNNSDLSCVLLEAKVPEKKRSEVIKNHRHIIITEKLFLNTIEAFEGSDWVIMKDETHQFGDVLMGALRFNAGTWPIRIGLTGTFPKDKLKAEKIKCHLGGGELTRVSPDYLQQEGFASKVHIRMYQTVHKEVEEVFDELINEKPCTYDWSIEEDYHLTNRHRIKAIADFLDTLPKDNTLILCHPQLGKILSEHLKCECINDEINVDQRAEWLTGFDGDGFRIAASYGTSGTGLSINRIYQLVLIDVGKNETNIMQGIGRGMRLDGERNFVDVIDISSNMKYAKKHRKERVKLYEREKYSFEQSDNFILV